MYTIALEEHYATQALLDAQAKNPVFDLRAFPMPSLDTKLCDLDTGRIAEMDAAAIDLQVLSLMTPGVEQLDAEDAVAIARDANDQLWATVQRVVAALTASPRIDEPTT